MTTGARVAEIDVGVVAAPPTDARVAAMDVAVLGAPPTAAAIAELDIAALVYLWPCTRQQCQVWTITRRDGTVLGFTTHDEDVVWRGVTHKACSSLTESASESASELGGVGNIEMTGVIADDAISAEDLYAGLYDDAYVEAWVIPWGADYEDAAPFRIAAGSTGKVTRGESSYNAEVLGPGARLQQAALVDFYTPGCRWPVFGDGTQCPVDKASLKVAGVAVTGAILRSVVNFSAADPGPPATFNGGTVVWLTGRNAGLSCQTDTVDFSGGVLSLWDLAPYPPQIGDTFDLYPGCPRTKDACVAYSVFDSFGGFPDVPGPDALQSNADSLFTGANA